MEQRADMTVEIERKFEVVGRRRVASPDPGRCWAVRAGRAEEHLLEAVYYDTPDLRLLAEG